jgi:hypothetical protein
MNQVSIVNLTPHDITVISEGKSLVFPKVLKTARVSSKTEFLTNFDTPEMSIPLTQVVFGELEGLPEPIEGVFFIVSRIVREAAKDRTDLLVPQGLIRDENGQPIGCESLSVN